jgi:hypothetical protein
MAMIDVRTIKGQDHVQFLGESGTGSFNAKDSENIHDGVAVCAGGIDAIDLENLLEVDTAGVEKPFLAFGGIGGFFDERAVWLDNDALPLVDEGTGDAFDTAKCEVVKDMHLDFLKHVLAFASSLVVLISLAVIVVDHPHTNDLVISIVI